MSRPARLAIAAVVALTAAVLVVDAAVSLASHAYLNLGSGVWLALAFDTYEGIFYRPLWDGHAYGGTRYFPLLPLATAALMRVGIPLVPAGLAVSMAGLAALAAAVVVLLKRLGVSTPLAALGAALAVAPYFVHQTAFAVRSEPLAAALSIFGLAAVAPLGGGAMSTGRLLLAAMLFVAAFATKMTSVYGPLAAAVALMVCGRRAEAIKLALVTFVGGVLMLAATNVASGGRALDSFRACALAGSRWDSFLTTDLVLRPLELIGTSRFMTVTFVITAVALLAQPRRWLSLPSLHLAASAAITAAIFTSPGTILTSQILDAYAAAIVVLVVLTARRAGALHTIGVTVLVTLALWAAGQNVLRVTAMRKDHVIARSAAERGELLAAVRKCNGAILSESPLVPLQAGERPILLDAFAFHVVVRNRPEIGRDLVERIAHAEFACIVLEQDPATERGRAWYRNVNLTEPVVRAMLEHYRFDSTVAGQRFYVAVE